MAIGVIATIAVIVAIGYVLTQVMPPRGTALVIGDRTISVGGFADRAVAAYRLQAVQANSMDALIDQSSELMIRHELLRQSAAPIVGMPDDAAIEAGIRERLGVAEDASQEDYLAALEQLLSTRGVSRTMYEELIQADLLAERMLDQFSSEVPEAGPQARLLVASSIDGAQIRTLRERTLAGEDFATVAVELGVADAETIDAGWLAIDALNEEVRGAVEGVEAGGVSEVVVPTGSLESVAYFVAERDEEREYDEAMLNQLKGIRLNEFVEEQRETITVENDLSEGERNWVVNKIEDSLS